MSRPATLFAVTVNHRHAPTEVRERAHLDDAKAVALIQALNEDEGCVSAMPVSTCNRTEIYVEVAPGHTIDAMLRTALGRVGADADLFFSHHAVHLHGIDAIRHLYRVSSGLESMMIGEPQITSQLKDAYRLGRASQEPGPGLLRAFQGAFRAGKRVRTETKISQGAVSVAFAAVELARKFFDHLCDQKALLVGAGETGALAARHFLQHDIGHLTVINRTFSRAEELAVTLNAERMATIEAARAEVHPREFEAARCGRVVARPWDELGAALAEADVVLSTTGAVDPVILPAMVSAAVAKRRGKPLFLLDIAVPRDIHPDVAKVANTFVFGLEDLDEIVQGNLAARRKQIPHAERIIDQELAEFQRWLDDVDLRPTVAEFKAYLEELKDKQVGFVRRKESDEVAALVEASLQQFIKKVLGRSMSSLKASESPAERERDLETLRRLFAPDGDDRG
ncbi:MAG TPA: glutamyl-tRNA reductase [Candidatus Krumholzibacteria bacterium]|nr:glutamyl-tRNA reductase [Candidatus Krumholzibacteria bacterium]